MSSSDLAICVRGLGKSYQIAHNQQRATTLAEAVVRKIRNPLTRPDRETFWALQDVNFDVHKGEVVGIIGRNGAGKSTLLKILSRITEPTKGEIDIYGRVGSLLEVGTGFHPELTGRENIYLNGGILGMRRSEITRRFDEIVSFAGVERFLDTPVKRYSSGMYVRLAFAVAAHLDSEVLIVDEVLAVGDMEFQNKCLNKMKDVGAAGRTVLVVSHNMSSIASLCTQGILLTSGTVSFAGGARETIEAYVTRLHTVVSEHACLDQQGYGIRKANVVVNTVDSNNGDAPTISAGAEAVLKLACCLPASSSLNLGLTIYSSDRDLAAVSTSALDSGIALPSGECIIRIPVPVERLPTGSYRLEAAIWDASRMYIQSDNLSFFHVVNSAHNKVGVVPRAPTLLAVPWEIEHA